MLFEPIDVTVKKHYDYIIYVLKKKEAVKYWVGPLGEVRFMGVFFDKNNQIIGINPISFSDIYSPNKLLKLIKANLSQIEEDKDKKTMQSIKDQEEYWLDWWNNEEKIPEEKEPTPYEEIELTKDELQQYFIQTIERSEQELSKTTWYKYYIKPACGISIKINNSTIAYDGQKINKIMLVETETHGIESINKLICFYDEKDMWLEDIDINTSESWENILFIFDKDDLTSSNTQNEEQQAYVALYEKLSPYNTIEENKDIIKHWLNMHKEMVE